VLEHLPERPLAGADDKQIKARGDGCNVVRGDILVFDLAAA
jgi:hypothetical protein